MKLPYAEDINYWRTSRSSPDSWIGKAKKQIEKLGGNLVMEAFGCESANNRSAYMLGFEIKEDKFKII